MTTLRRQNHHIKKIDHHNHAAYPVDHVDREYRSFLKRRTVNSTDVPSKIMREAAAAFSTRPIVQTRISKKAQKMIIFRARLSSSGSRIREEEGCIVIPNDLQLSMSGNTLFRKEDRLGDERVLFFTTDQNLSLLAKADYWLVDGTFSTAPIQFNQLFSVHAPVGVDDGRQVLPLAFFLLTCKSQEVYTHALELLSDTAV